MYALVLWVGYGSKSVISTDTLVPDKNEGEQSFARYSDDKLYKVKIVRKSDDAEYLSLLSVSTDGEVMVKGKNIGKRLAFNEQIKIKSQKKIERKKKVNKAQSSNLVLLKSKSIFDSEVSDESEERNEQEKSPKSRNATCAKNQVLEQEILETNLPCTSGLHMKDIKIIKQNKGKKRKDVDVLMETESDISITSETETATMSHVLSKRARLMTNDPDDDTDDPHDNSCRISLPENEQRGEHNFNASDSGDDDVDPLVECRRSGPNKTLLCNKFKGIWIKETDKLSLVRWKSQPKNMVRRILRILVGTKNLKNMCARGKSSKRVPVPKDITELIEYYVNTKCNPGLRPAEYTTVVNYMCTTLRHPKK